ncbi:MAG: TonB-dependent receptor [Haliea sp.]|uniref:TonB-dependent receptor n=1 Tax=Haliea sp. TaxID=1932666 RepID=UPI000C5548E3|nr:TonB-dependent receptor [Haliea sp.]MBM68655.1 TonB-dependent receptor [Haliea sp.]|tara:strand:- start:3462 stop:5807 length:2346 start_codon:yes stop_codon:yes gene_type:complete
MRHFSSLSLLASSIALIVSGNAIAQENQRNVALEEIIVTAQKREQNLQSVPIAVTALNAQTLNMFRVTNTEDLSNLAPNLNIQNQGRGTIPQINIRGVSSGVSAAEVDPKIATYLDGVYIGRTIGSIFDMADIERVEVLRGPQGTLFGRNATGGAISITTSAPTGEFGLSQDVSVGNLNAQRFRTILNLPSVGPLSVKLSYLYDSNDGYSDNLIAGRTLDLRLRNPEMGVLTYAENLGSKNVEAFMLAANLDFDTINVDYRFDYTDSLTVGAPVQQVGIIGATAPLVGAINQFQPLYGGITNLSTTPLKDVAAATSEEPLLIQGHNVTVSWEINDNLSLKSITAFRQMDQRPAIYDLGATGGWKFTAAQLGALLQGDVGGILGNPPGPNDSLFTLLTARALEQEQFSEELQLTWSTDNYTLVGGVFYFQEEAEARNVLGVLQPVANGVVIPTPFDAIFGSGVNSTDTDNSSWAVFAEGTFHATEKLDVTVGIRRTEDDREIELIDISATSGGGSLDEGLYKLSYGETNYNVVLSYNWADDVMSYAKVSTGFVAGGILNGISYDPESITNYELGLKSQFLDNRLRLNAAAFFMDYEDLQVQLFEDGKQSFENAGNVEVTGLEIEMDAILGEGLTLSTTLGTYDYEYKEYIRNGVNVADDVRPIRAPDFNTRISLQYDFGQKMLGGAPFMRLDSRYLAEGENTAFASGFPEADRLSQREAYWLINARAGVMEIPMGSAVSSVSFWVKNLLDEDEINVFGNEVINMTAQYSLPRTYGIDFNITF